MYNICERVLFVVMKGDITWQLRDAKIIKIEF